MGKDYKIMLAALGITFLLIIGFSFWQGKGTSAGDTGTPVTADIQGVSVDPLNYDLGDVPINGGKVTKEYSVANTTDFTLKIKKIVTSCMCTEAKVVIGNKESKFFGMEHPMDKNPPINMELASGETAKVVVSFDPAAHGPEGVGPFDRVVWLTFSDPAGVKELTFNGTVTN